MDTVELDLQGMTCAACASRIEKVLSKQPGVEKAEVNFAAERARVTASGVPLQTLIDAVAKSGYTASQHVEGSAAPESHAAGLLRRFIIAAIFTVPAMVVSMGFGMHRWAGIVSGILITPVQIWAGWPFLRSAVKNARHGAATMDTLVAVGTSAAYIYSAYAVLTGGTDAYFETAGAIITLILLGKYLEASSRGRASAAIRALAERGAKEASVLRDGLEVRIPVADLRVGDRFVVRPGEKLATDGVVRDGSGDIDTSLVTGESVPRAVEPGDEVIGGTVNVQGLLVIEATKVGSDTALAQIARLVEEAQTSKAPIQRLADRVAGIFVPIVLLLAAATFTGWMLTGHSLRAALVPTVAVLIIACPCAMGLATPAAIMVGTARGAAMGVLIRGGEVLERSRRIDTVVLDKTGTITSGRMTVTRVVADTWNGGSASTDEILRIAAAVEQGSEHPIARAVVAAAVARAPVGAATASAPAPTTTGGSPAAIPSVSDFAAASGAGARGTVEGRDAAVGRPAYLGSLGMMSCTELDEQARHLESKGETIFYVGWDRRVRGLIGVADSIKPSSARAVAALHELGCRVVMLTGDSGATAAAIAREAGVDEVRAELRPGDKAAAVKELQAAGQTVAVAGDGVNDAPALAQADLGVAIGSGTDVAIEASDITLVGDDLLGVPSAIRLARRTYRAIIQNLFWAFGYNVALIPLAAFGKVNPMLAAAAMGTSSVSVLMNALRLRRVPAYGTGHGTGHGAEGAKA